MRERVMAVLANPVVQAALLLADYALIIMAASR